MSQTMDAYFAGLFDGEGHFKLTTNNNGKNTRAIIQVNMTCVHTMQAIANYFGGTIAPKRVPTGCKPVWVWRASNNQAIVIMHQVLPYLITKHKVVRNILDSAFYGRRGSSKKLIANLPPSLPEVAEFIK